MRKYWQRLQIIVKLVPHCFRVQIHVITFDIGLNIASQGRQRVFLNNQFLSFVNSKVIS